MLRSSLFTASAFALMAGAAAQTPQALTAEKVPGAIKHAGTYHVSTGTWTRTGGQSANIGPDVIYSNTSDSGYFASFGGAGGTAPNSENFDEGSLPGQFNTLVTGANRDEYNVNCVQIGYCDLGAAGSGGWTLNFFSEYAPCTLNTAPDATVVATALPAGGCWIVDLDLSGGGEFCLTAEAEGIHDMDPALDSFGWSFTFAGTDGTAAAGFLLKGDPVGTDPNYVTGLPTDGTGTYYGPASLCANGGTTGFLTQDLWWLEDPTGVNSNCFFFGGYSNNNGPGACGQNNPYASWHMEIQADANPCNVTLGTQYCTSNPNSLGVVTALTITGSDVAADDNVTLTAELPTNSFGFFVTSVNQGMVNNPGGSSGILCLGADIGRYVGPGQIKNSGATGIISLSTTAGEWSLTAVPQASGPYAAAAGITSNFQFWHRDTGMGGATSNFSDAYTITWN